MKNQELHQESLKYIEKTNVKYRKTLGQYFTPKTTREILLSKLPKINKPKILDPGSGTGEFLITAKELFEDAELHGWEIDKKLAQISKKLVPGANIEVVDTLKKGENEKYDFVIGNPPYYEFKPTSEIRERYGEIINGRANIYGIFIYKSIKLLKEGGYLAFVVPPSMNNGAYFKKLRKFIVDNCNIEYISIQKASDLFEDALQSVMLLVLKKGANNGNYIFKKNGILIFSEDVKYLKRMFKYSTTLHDIGYEVKTGRLVWNENKNLLTNNAQGTVPLIWSHNITKVGLKLNNNHKPQYVKKNDYDTGPAIVVNRIVGRPGNGQLKAALIPKGKKFIAENHVNVIFPSHQLRLPRKKLSSTLESILSQLNSPKKVGVLQQITGNTQISKTELENLFPLKVGSKI